MTRYKKVEFKNFRAFSSYTVHLKHFNIFVGPNNAGKSTIVTAFRILAAAFRKANAKKAEIVTGPNGKVYGHRIDISSISISEENLFHNYNDQEPAEIIFTLESGNKLILFFPDVGACNLIIDMKIGSASTPSSFRTHCNAPIGFVPILGPVDQVERLFDKDAARRALYNFGAARNFRNIWHHYPENFEHFRRMLQETWPGMDIDRPEIVREDQGLVLKMLCPEERIPREIFWSGFGFQVWVQMLTHIVQHSESAIFIIDEPDIYLHSVLQRQLIHILRDLGPDIILATHSTEIVAEAETDEIVLINKKKRVASRLRNPAQLSSVFDALGSNTNPILTQLAKTRNAVFVEGKDFQIISQFAKKLGVETVSRRSSFADIPMGGFNPQRAKSIKDGIEATLGRDVTAIIILDGDYRCVEERNNFETECQIFAEYCKVLSVKELENLLVVPAAISRALSRQRQGVTVPVDTVEHWIEGFLKEKKIYSQSRYLSSMRDFYRKYYPKEDAAVVDEKGLTEFESLWADNACNLVSGKELLRTINDHAQKQYKVSVTPFRIIESMHREEINGEVIGLVNEIAQRTNRSL